MAVSEVLDQADPVVSDHPASREAVRVVIRVTLGSAADHVITVGLATTAPLAVSEMGHMTGNVAAACQAFSALVSRADRAGVHLAESEPEWAIVAVAMDSAAARAMAPQTVRLGGAVPHPAATPVVSIVEASPIVVAVATDSRAATGWGRPS